MSVRRHPSVALALSALLLLTACGGSGSDAEPEQSAAASASASAEPSEAASDEPTEEPTAEPSAEPTEEPTAEPTPVPTIVPVPSAEATGPPLAATECKEPKLDTDGVEMVAVKLTKTGDVVTMTVTLDQPPPKTRDILWSIWASRSDGADGPKVVQLGAEIAEGGEVAHFVFANGSQTNLDGRFKVSGKKVTAEFPASAITSLGAGARWYATETVEHETKDYCPGGRGTEAKDVDAVEFPATWF